MTPAPRLLVHLRVCGPGTLKKDRQDVSRKAYFLTVCMPIILGGKSLDEFGDPKASHEERSYAFYEVDHPILADALIDLFKAEYEGKDGPVPIFAIVKDGNLSQTVRYREAVEWLELYASGDPDPGTWVDPGCTVDRATMLLVGYHRQARDWEPLVRDELPDCKTLPSVPILEEVDLNILRILAKYQHSVKAVDIATDFDRHHVSERLHFLHEHGLVFWPPKTRKGAAITDKGREYLDAAKPPQTSR